jgi:bromodomain and PHD finger-containing protein 1
MLKREKTKRELYLLEQQSSKYELNPFNGVFLQGLMNRLFELDTNGYFWLPVDPVHVPTYYNVIKNPMDMETMQNKISALKYNTFEEFEADFNLIISNCYRFNPKSSPFYKAAVKLKEQVRYSLLSVFFRVIQFENGLFFC